MLPNTDEEEPSDTKAPFPSPLTLLQIATRLVISNP